MRDYSQFQTEPGYFRSVARHISEWSRLKKAAMAAGVVLALGGYAYGFYNIIGSANKTTGRRRLQAQQRLYSDGLSAESRRRNKEY